MFALRALARKNGLRAQALSVTSKHILSHGQSCLGYLNSHNAVRLMSSAEGGEVDANPVAKEEKVLGEINEESEKSDKKLQVVAAQISEVDKAYEKAIKSFNRYELNDLVGRLQQFSKMLYAEAYMPDELESHTDRRNWKFHFSERVENIYGQVRGPAVTFMNPLGGFHDSPIKYDLTVGKYTASVLWADREHDEHPGVGNGRLVQIGPLVIYNGVGYEGYECYGQTGVHGYYHLMHRLTKSAGCGKWDRDEVDALIRFILEDMIPHNTTDLEILFRKFHRNEDYEYLYAADKYLFDEEMKEKGFITDIEEKYISYWGEKY